MPARFLSDGKLDLEAVTAELDRFLALLLKEMHLQLRYEICRGAAAEAGAPAVEGAAEVSAVFSGPDEDLMLLRNAELLNAIEHLAFRWLRLEPHDHERVRLDCADYRAQRLAELRLTAEMAAERVRQTRQPVKMNPMSPRERRVVHLALKDLPGVRTASEGVGEQRQVVVFPCPDPG